MCEEFARQGNKVTLVVPDYRMSKQSAFDYYNLENNFEIKKIKISYFLSLSKFSERLSFFMRQIWFLFKLLFIHIEKDTVVYTRNLEIARIFGLKGCKVICELHSYIDNSFRNLILDKNIKYVVLNEQLKKILQSKGVNNDNISIEPSAVDLEIFDINANKNEARKKLRLPTDKIILGYTGSFKTMNQEKGIMDCLKALQELNQKQNQYFFIAVGGHKNYINEYKKLIKNDIEKSALLLERVDLRTLALYQKTFDICLMPFPDIDHYRLFMSPLKMFEYMVSKRPIVASDLPSIREVLNENNCYFVEPGNPDSFLEQIKNVSNDSFLAQKKANQAYMDVQGFTWDKRVERIINFVK